jgi:hypothetical protein
MFNLYKQYLYVLFNNSISLANIFTDVTLYTNSGSFGTFNFGDSYMNASQKWLGLASYIN